MHGAATRVSVADTAFAARQPQWDFDAIGQWTDPAESAQHIAWVRALWDEIEPNLQATAYVNHLSPDDRPEKVRASFGENYERLCELNRAPHIDRPLPELSLEHVAQFVEQRLRRDDDMLADTVFEEFVAGAAGDQRRDQHVRVEQ